MLKLVQINDGLQIDPVDNLNGFRSGKCSTTCFKKVPLSHIKVLLVIFVLANCVMIY